MSSNFIPSRSKRGSNPSILCVMVLLLLSDFLSVKSLRSTTLTLVTALFTGIETTMNLSDFQSVIFTGYANSASR